MYRRENGSFLPLFTRSFFFSLSLASVILYRIFQKKTTHQICFGLYNRCRGNVHFCETRRNRIDNPTPQLLDLKYSDNII